MPCAAAWSLNELLDIFASTSAVFVPTMLKQATEGIVVSLAFTFLVLALLNVLLFFHEAFASGPSQQRIVNLQATALIFQRLALLFVVLMGSCIAIALAGNASIGFIGAIMVCLVYMIGITVSAGLIGWSVSARLSIAPPPLTESSSSFVEPEPDDEGY